MHEYNFHMCRYSGNKYTTCPSEQDGEFCNLSFTAAVLYPIIIYLFWQMIYFVWVSKRIYLSNIL